MFNHIYKYQVCAEFDPVFLILRGERNASSSDHLPSVKQEICTGALSPHLVISWHPVCHQGLNHCLWVHYVQNSFMSARREVVVSADGGKLQHFLAMRAHECCGTHERGRIIPPTSRHGPQCGFRRCGTVLHRESSLLSGALKQFSMIEEFWVILVGVVL